MKKLYLYVQVLIIGIASLEIVSCTEPSSSPFQNGSVVAVRTELDNSFSASSVLSPADEDTADSLGVTSVAIVAKNVFLRSDTSDTYSDPNLSEDLIRPEKFIMRFDESGRQYVGERLITAATYRRARFDIVPINSQTDSAIFAADPVTAAQFSGTNITIIIQGNIWRNNVAMPFIYRSSAMGSGQALFSEPLVVTSEAPKEVLLRFSTFAAFTNKGIWMDPRDSRNAAAIEANLKVSVKAVLASGTQ
jgi:hypothetical protein